MSTSSFSSAALSLVAKPPVGGLLGRPTAVRQQASLPPSGAATLRKAPRPSSPGSAFLGPSSPPLFVPAAATPRSRASTLLVRASVATPQAADLVSSVLDFLRKAFAPIAPQQQQEPLSMPGEQYLRPRRRVAVVGATGRTGKHVVKELVQQGHSVVALVSSEERAKEVLGEGEGLRLGSAEERGQVETVVGSALDRDAVGALLAGADGVVCCIAARFVPPQGYAADSTPEDVYWKAVRNIVDAAVEELSQGKEAEGEKEEGEETLNDVPIRVLFDFSELAPPSPAAADNGSSSSSTNGAAQGVGVAEDARLSGWNRLDDVIMGGQSESILRPGDGYAVFEGIVRVEGGGFCASRVAFPKGPLDGSAYEGLKLRVRGDGQRYKLNLRDSLERSEFQYQASFDTVRGQWVDILVPFSRFRGVERSRAAPDAPPLNSSRLCTLGIVLSRFQYDGFPNPLFRPGPFRLEIESISLVRRPQPQFVLVSSAAVERSARAETVAEREASIPIVKLNPGAVLSWKLSGEDALRASGLRYTIVRPCGLTDKDEDETFLLESAQGDVITGLISRPETAAVCAAALNNPDAVNTTFEVRRDDLTKGLSMEQRHWDNHFARLRPDIPGSIVQYPAVPPELSAAFKG